VHTRDWVTNDNRPQDTPVVRADLPLSQSIGGASQALPGDVARILQLQRLAGNRAVGDWLSTLGVHPDQRSSDCASSKQGPRDMSADRLVEHFSVQRNGTATLPWLVEGAKDVATGVGVGLGALAAGVAAGLGTLLIPRTTIVSGSEEALMLARDRVQAALNALRSAIAGLTAMAAATLTAEEIERMKGQHVGIIGTVEEFIRANGRAVMRCANELGAFRAAAARLLEYYNQALDQVNKFELIRLIEQLEQAIQDLLACMGAQAPSP
jgi:hypothetical protein